MLSISIIHHERGKMLSCRRQRSTCPSLPWETSSLPLSMDDPLTSRIGQFYHYHSPTIIIIIIIMMHRPLDFPPLLVFLPTLMIASIILLLLVDDSLIHIITSGTANWLAFSKTLLVETRRRWWLPVFHRRIIIMKRWSFSSKCDQWDKNTMVEKIQIFS